MAFSEYMNFHVLNQEKRKYTLYYEIWVSKASLGEWASFSGKKTRQITAILQLQRKRKSKQLQIFRHLRTTACCELLKYPNWLEFFLHKKTCQMTAVYYEATHLFKKETEIASHFFRARYNSTTLRFFFKFVSRANCSIIYLPTKWPRKQKM